MYRVKLITRLVVSALMAVTLVFMVAVTLCAQDSDGDGIPDSLDNCPWDFNPDQSDTDGFVDYIDEDFEDGIIAPIWMVSVCDESTKVFESGGVLNIYVPEGPSSCRIQPALPVPLCQ